MRESSMTATGAHNEKKFVFVATHSSDFLMGAIQSGATVNIIGLTWGNEVATARLLPSQDLVVLMNAPALPVPLIPTIRTRRSSSAQ